MELRPLTADQLRELANQMVPTDVPVGRPTLTMIFALGLTILAELREIRQHLTKPTVTAHGPAIGPLDEPVYYSRSQSPPRHRPCSVYKGFCPDADMCDHLPAEKKPCKTLTNEEYNALLRAYPRT